MTSIGNVFADLGLENPEELLAKLSPQFASLRR
jgi:hypothetical protein